MVAQPSPVRQSLVHRSPEWPSTPVDKGRAVCCVDGRLAAASRADRARRVIRTMVAGASGPRFLLLADVAEVLNISSSQAYALVRNGDLDAIKIGGRGQWRGVAGRGWNYT